MAKQKSKYLNIIILGAVILLAILIIYIAFTRSAKIKEIAEIERIIDQDIDTAGNYEDLVKSKAFSTTYHNGFDFSSKDKERARTDAEAIYKALGTWQFNHPDTVFSVYNSAGSKAFASLIADEFFKEYDLAIYEHLNHLGASDLNKVNDIVKQLPDQP